MARTSVTTQKVVRTGLVPALSEPTVDGDVVDCGEVFLYVDNTTAGAVTVTVNSTASQDGLAVSNLAVSVAASATALIGPLPARTFGQDSGTADAGRAYVDYSVQTGVNRAVISF